MIVTYKKISLALLLWGAHFFLFSQGVSADYWHKAKLITSSNDTLKGLIRYDFDRETIFFSRDEKVNVYTAKKVVKTVFIDSLSLSERQIVSCIRLLKNGLEVNNLFEFEMIIGDFELLSREIVVLTAASSTVTMGFGGGSREIRYEYFIYDRKNKKVTNIVVNRRHLDEVFGSKSEAILTYIKENKLKSHRKMDVLQVFNYYKTLL